MRSLLVFDLVGPMAHFRKFDTNSSSLTYLFPPRSTLAGIIAGVIGCNRDAYYGLFLPENSRIGLAVKIPPRKLMQTVNYMYVTSRSHLNNNQGHTQIPVEFLLPEIGDSPDKGMRMHLCYRIYFQHQDEELMEDVKRRVIKKEYVYPPYLGITEMIGQLQWVAEVSESDMEKRRVDHPIQLHSVCPLDALQERTLDIGGRHSVIYYKERMCRYFTDGRVIAETKDYLYANSGVIKARPKQSVTTVNYDGRQEHILFM